MLVQGRGAGREGDQGIHQLSHQARAREVVKLSNAYLNCHVAAARSAIKRKITADEDTDTACETAARSSFRATKTSGCSCIDLADIATSVDLQFGEIGGVERIFCASP